MLNTPNIVTKVKVESTTFEIVAYRKLSESECTFAIKQYLRQNHLKEIPPNKKINIMTVIGSIE